MHLLKLITPTGHDFTTTSVQAGTYFKVPVTDCFAH